MTIGRLSAKYESNGNPATISTGWGDSGGKSYGCYQLASNMGSVRSFIYWLQKNGNEYGDMLDNFEIGSAAFDKLWTDIATKDGGNFKALQHDYIAYAYFEPAKRALQRNGYDLDKHYHVMKDIVWSAAVQHGVGSVVELFNTAAQRIDRSWHNMSYVDDARFDEAMIKSIYLNVRRTPEWTGGAPALRYGLYTRFENECAEALQMLRAEMEGNA